MTMVTQRRHHSSNTTHSRGNWSSLVVRRTHAAATCCRRRPGRPVPKPQPPGNVREQTINVPCRWPEHAARITQLCRNGLRQTLLSSFTAQTAVFLDFLSSHSNFSRTKHMSGPLDSLQSRLAAQSRCRRPGVPGIEPGSDQAERNSVINSTATQRCKT